MKLKLESRHFLIMGKIVSTILLLFVIIVWTMFMIIIVPLILITIYHSGKKNLSSFRFSLAMIPAVVCAALVYRIWKRKELPVINYPKITVGPRPGMKRAK